MCIRDRHWIVRHLIRRPICRLGSKVKVAGKSKILAANTLASPVSRLHGEHSDDDQRSERQRDWTRLVSVAMKIILTFDIKDGPDTLVVITKNTDNDQIVSLLPHRYRVAGAFLRKCVRAPRGDGPSSAWMNCGLSADLIGSRLLFLGEIWENDGRTSHAAIGF